MPPLVVPLRTVGRLPDEQTAGSGGGDMVDSSSGDNSNHRRSRRGESKAPDSGDFEALRKFANSFPMNSRIFTLARLAI